MPKFKLEKQIIKILEGLKSADITVDVNQLNDIGGPAYANIYGGTNQLLNSLAAIFAANENVDLNIIAAFLTDPVNTNLTQATEALDRIDRSSITEDDLTILESAVELKALVVAEIADDTATRLANAASGIAGRQSSNRPKMTALLSIGHL